MNLLEGAMTPIKTLPMWITTPEGTKITPMQTNFLPIWAGSVQKASDLSVMWSPAKTRDITAAAAVVARQIPVSASGSTARTIIRRSRASSLPTP